MVENLPLLRASLKPKYAALPAEQLDSIVKTIYGPAVEAEDVENLFSDIGNGISQFAKRAVPVIGKALPSIAQGAMTGATVGGPWGALIGAAAGAAGGILSQSKSGTARSIGGAIQGAGTLISTVRGSGATGALGSLGSIASGALGATPGGQSMAALLGRQNSPMGGSAGAVLGMLARPELQQALQAALMGGFGRQNISIGQQQIPVHQMLSAFSQLAQRAAHEAAQFDENAEKTPAFAEIAAETLGIDADDAEGRTDALLTLLALTPSLWMSRPAQPVTVNLTQTEPKAGDNEYFWLQGAENEEGSEWDAEDWNVDTEDWPEDQEDWDVSDESEGEQSYA